MTDEYTQALADLERQRGLGEISSGQYLAAKARIEAERKKAGKPGRIFLLVLVCCGCCSSEAVWL